MDDLLTGDIRPVRPAPPPPKSRSMGPQPRNDDLLIIQSEEEERPRPVSRTSNKVSSQRSCHNGLPRSASLPLTNGVQKKKAPPPRPPPPKVNTTQPSLEKSHPIFHRLHKFSVRKKTHHQLEQNNSSRCGSMFSKLRGPPPSRPRLSSAHTTMSAPSTPVCEASLIDFSSPPSSPTTRSGSDGLSVNSFGSESSTGNQSSGFDDIFDPFASVQEPSAFVQPRKVGASSFFSSTFAGPVAQTVRETNANQDPFDMLARRANMNSTQTQKPQTCVMQIQGTAPPARVSASVSQPATQNTSNKPEQKNSFRPTIIRPKAPVSSCQVESAGDSGISMNNQLSDLVSINWSAAASRGSSTHIIDQTIPEEPPPLPPRPEAEDEDEDRPHGVAEFDFVASQTSDLDFRVGDVVQLLYRISEEWLFGRCGLKEGMFPQAFIKTVVPLAGEKPPVVSSSHSSVINAATSSHQPPALNTSIGSSQVVTAIYTFQAEAPEDLTIYEGSAVRVMGRLNDQWLYGESSGKCGQFPANFVDRIPPNLPEMSPSYN
ncbi:uncharacterized protein B0303.7-like isoform X1 [Homarus americanus]|uniref:uncharacterized protein B0303.7-like isoform X1 n=1 Tax=Homarus americanus TaxID=6706 RepID=UPI001C45AA72|nr:uncharacterized protein B0303.7-like isoform X1 [Homarus americanus]